MKNKNDDNFFYDHKNNGILSNDKKKYWHFLKAEKNHDTLSYNSPGNDREIYGKKITMTKVIYGKIS